LGKPETIKVVSELGEGVPQGGTQFEDLRLLGEREAIEEEGDGAIHLEKFVHSPYQGVAVATHMVQAHSFGIRDNQIKVK